MIKVVMVTNKNKLVVLLEGGDRIPKLTPTCLLVFCVQGESLPLEGSHDPPKAALCPP